MNLNLAAHFLILLALLGANLPFLSKKLFLMFSVRQPKSISWQLLEIVCNYLVVGVFAYLFEKQTSNVFEQGWEFYVITFCLFLILAFPGFVYCHLRK